MLSLASKQGEKLNLYSVLKKSVDNACGPHTAAQIDAPLKNFQQIRDELVQITPSRSDTHALERLINSAKSYISMWSTISQSFSFGKEKVLPLPIKLGQYRRKVHMV